MTSVLRITITSPRKSCKRRRPHPEKADKAAKESSASQPVRTVGPVTRSVTRDTHGTSFVSGVFHVLLVIEGDHDSDRVMIYMPSVVTGKTRKLARPYYGPYQVLRSHLRTLKPN